MTPRAMMLEIMKDLFVLENKVRRVSGGNFARGQPGNGKNVGLDPSSLSYSCVTLGRLSNLSVLGL